MSKYSIRYDFVPSDVVLGMFDGDYAFVTCKYKYDKWLALSIFKRICGYAPHDQRDSEMQLKKTIYNAVSTIANEPVEGFKYVDHNENLYSLTYHDEECHDMTIEDPRGFKVSVTAENFYYMLEKCGFNMKNGVFAGHKFAYAWIDKDSRFMIVDAESDKFKKIREESIALKDKVDNKKFLTKSKLEVGKVYKGTEKMPGKWVYLGTHDVYDSRYHLNALNNSEFRYLTKEEVKAKSKIDSNVAEFLKEKRVVFYNLEGKGDKMPYLMLSSLSKHIDCEVNEDLTKHMMLHNGVFPATYENLAADMSKNPLFNMIDLSTYKPHAKKLSIEEFNKLFAAMYSNHVKYHSIKTLFPFECGYSYSDCPKVWSNVYNRVVELHLGSTYYNSGNNNWSMSIRKIDDSDNYWRSRDNKTLKDIGGKGPDDTEELYRAIDPYVPTAKYISGIDVPDLVMVYLCKKQEAPMLQRFSSNSVFDF